MRMEFVRYFLGQTRIQMMKFFPGHLVFEHLRLMLPQMWHPLAQVQLLLLIWIESWTRNIFILS